MELAFEKDTALNVVQGKLFINRFALKMLKI